MFRSWANNFFQQKTFWHISPHLKKGTSLSEYCIYVYSTQGTCPNHLVDYTPQFCYLFSCSNMPYRNCSTCNVIGWYIVHKTLIYYSACNIMGYYDTLSDELWKFLCIFPQISTTYSYILIIYQKKNPFKKSQLILYNVFF